MSDRWGHLGRHVRVLAAAAVGLFTVLPAFSSGSAGAQENTTTLPPLTLTLPTLFPADPNGPNTTLPPIVLPVPALESVVTTPPAPAPTSAAPAAGRTTGTTFRRSTIEHSPRPNTVPQRNGPPSRPVTTLSPAEDGGTGTQADTGFDGSLPFGETRLTGSEPRELGSDDELDARVRSMASVAAGLLVLVIVGMGGWLLSQARIVEHTPRRILPAPGP